MAGFTRFNGKSMRGFADPYANVENDDPLELSDFRWPLAFVDKRHREVIQGGKISDQSWRMKERMKTVSVALVLCLNVGVDPPDVVKTQPCARLECWIDPQSMSPQKALETIGATLQKQYERWQTRARYKQSLDPTVEEVKKLCSSLRRSAKDERVLFHYNGHGVPRPTVNGEIWVFNKNFTQYIPLSVFDLHSWMGSPSIYVLDCSSAGIIVDSFRHFPGEREQPESSMLKNCILLAACGANELLPMCESLPADLFTSCLTTPIQIALRWYILQSAGKLVKGVTLEQVEKLPGALNDRRTMLGELNWIFTAITDTIAWNVLPRDLFQKLFRQDLLVASLFRNFLLAERIMRVYNCTPVSCPQLPPTYLHPMWNAWDLALDMCLVQLASANGEAERPAATPTTGAAATVAPAPSPAVFEHSSFFAEQLTAFEVWLTCGSETRSPPEQLPIVLQVLLSQVHRLRALELLGKFLDLGPWAVSLALSVGIFPYVLKLLQSSARELRQMLVFIWAKILAVDHTCQADLVKDLGHKYFLAVLEDRHAQAELRTLAAFVLAMIVNNYPTGQESVLQGNVISVCLEQLNSPEPLLRQWLALCLGKVWAEFSPAKWCGARDLAHEKLYRLLTDSKPEVRAAAVYALGTFASHAPEDRGEQNSHIDHGIGIKLCSVVSDGSPLVRKELVAAFAGLVSAFDGQFVSIASLWMDEEKATGSSGHLNPSTPSSDGSSSAYSLLPASAAKFVGSKNNLVSSPRPVSPGPLLFSSGSSGCLESWNESNSESSYGSSQRIHALNFTSPAYGAASGGVGSAGIKRAASTSSFTSSLPTVTNMYTAVWRTLIQLAFDPFPGVNEMASILVNSIKGKASASGRAARGGVQQQQIGHMNSLHSQSQAASPALRSSLLAERVAGEVEGGGALSVMSPGLPADVGNSRRRQAQCSEEPTAPTSARSDDSSEDSASSLAVQPPITRPSPPPGSLQAALSTRFFEWCCAQFAQPTSMCAGLLHSEGETEDQRREKEYLHRRNLRIRTEALDEHVKAEPPSDELFASDNSSGTPAVVRFHPYESHLLVADKEGVSVWDWERGSRVNHFFNHNPKHTRITALELLNTHSSALVAVGSDDGAVRVWKNYEGGIVGSGTAELVTASQVLSDLLHMKRGAGLVLDWQQPTRTMLASGDVRHIRVWDVDRELRVQDMPTGADSCVTCLCSDTINRSLVVAGCGDGSVRVFDRRLSPNECRVLTMREHDSWIVNCYLQQSHDGWIISGSTSGEIKFWDFRDPHFSESITAKNVGPGMSCMEVHHGANMIACGFHSQQINMYSSGGEPLASVRHYDGFMGQRIGPVNCLAFHPHKLTLASGNADGIVAVYTMAGSRKR